MTHADWIGGFGVILLLAAYYLNLRNILKPESLIYIGLNFAGAGISCIASILLNYLPFIILEAVWALVSLVAFIKQITKN